MNKNSFFMMLLAVVFILSTTTGTFAYGTFHNPNDYTKSNHNFASNILIARCNKCVKCGKELEQMGDQAMESRDFKSAHYYYKEALKTYQFELSSNPSNRCVKNGFSRTKMKLKQFKH